MADRARETASARTGKSGVWRERVTAVAPLALFCSVMGVLSVGAGALVALLVPSGEVRALVWLVVTVLGAAGAGLWWGLTPVTERLRVLNRALGQARPPRPHHR
ncbi:hypothetical protein [Streptomyces europaeiscabiei]|uniref:hypothetical protein n=1 Tax=Streptomyces europaeiscabiei TaxID=146819 RepID=UPI0029A1513E|nr:hypothetical protein [Streptomyces europaeiscabiei]MDX3844252.1 hypothetical protein [Streptomyces europaeiscabiei]